MAIKKFFSRSALLRTAAVAALTIGSSIGAASIAYADDSPPPADKSPHHGHDNDPAWAVCKTQADAQKLAPGDARHEFMRTCMKSAKNTPPATH